jgi:hypothetical protein
LPTSVKWPLLAALLTWASTTSSPTKIKQRFDPKKKALSSLVPSHSIGLPYQRPQVEDVPETPVVSHNARLYEVHDLAGARLELASMNEEAPVEVPAWPPSPQDPVHRRIVRFQDENLQLQQIGEDEVSRLRQEIFDLEDHFKALEERGP